MDSTNLTMMDSAMDQIVTQLIDEDEELSPISTDITKVTSKSGAERKNSSPSLCKVSLEMVNDVCSALAKDCPLASAREFFMTVSRQTVLETVEFLNDCLVQRTKFAHSSREQAMKAFYSTFVQKQPAVAKFAGSPQAASWLCLRLFQRLVEENYPLASPTQEASKMKAIKTLDDHDKDIVSHIGGSILTKLKQTISSLKENETRLEMLSCIDRMSKSCVESYDSHSKLSTTLNRGNLRFLKPETQQLFQYLEIETRTVCNKDDDTPVRLFDFEERCSNSETITTAFHAANYSASASHEARDFLFSKLTQLYFKVRVHHECKMFKERLRVKQNITSAKGLRKTLQTKTSV